MLKNILKIEEKKIIFVLLFIIIDTLLLFSFGKSYSKFIIFESLYLHDLLNLIVFSLIVLNFINKGSRIKSIEIFSLIALIYLIHSLFLSKNISNSYYIIIRQFMLFGYLIFYYSIVKKIASNKNALNLLYKFIIIFSKLSVLTQIIYVIYLFIIKDINPFFERYYYSPITIFGIIIFSSFVIITFKGYKKWIYFTLTLILSLTMGHDSIYLSMLVIFFAYLFITLNTKLKIIAILLSIATLFFLFYQVPTFNDANVEWRLYYWQQGLHKIILENYFTFGEGFGIEYFGETQQNYLNDIMKKYGHNVVMTEQDRYVIPFHNSFITIMYNIGGIAIILLYYPLVMFRKKLTESTEKTILFFALIGLTVFTAFNVILELPHSSSVYWLVYFILIYKLKNNNIQRIL